MARVSREVQVCKAPYSCLTIDLSPTNLNQVRSRFLNFWKRKKLTQWFLTQVHTPTKKLKVANLRSQESRNKLSDSWTKCWRSRDSQVQPKQHLLNQLLWKYHNLRSACPMPYPMWKQLLETTQHKKWEASCPLNCQFALQESKFSWLVRKEICTNKHKHRDTNEKKLLRPKATDLIQVGLQVLSKESLKLRSPGRDIVRLLEAVEGVKEGGAERGWCKPLQPLHGPSGWHCLATLKRLLMINHVNHILLHIYTLFFILCGFSCLECHNTVSHCWLRASKGKEHGATIQVDFAAWPYLGNKH